MKYNKLFEPMNIGKCEIKNRIVMAPMLVGLGTIDGTVTEKQLDYYEERAKEKFDILHIIQCLQRIL